MTLDIMSDYLRLPSAILLTHVHLLENVATLLPKLSERIIGLLMTIIKDLISGADQTR